MGSLSRSTSASTRASPGVARTRDHRPMAEQHFYNSVPTLVQEAVEGLVITNPQLKRLDGFPHVRRQHGYYSDGAGRPLCAREQAAQGAIGTMCAILSSSPAPPPPQVKVVYNPQHDGANKVAVVSGRCTFLTEQGIGLQGVGFFSR